MATYCIGDVQGCYDELQRLLAIIKYNEHRDHLWFVGDLVNRGPKSLEVLRLVKSLPNTKVVLGNHDLHLMVFSQQAVNFEVTSLRPIIAAPDGQELITWLRMQSLIYYSHQYACAVVHAGIYPGWDLEAALMYAQEAEQLLHNEKTYSEFLAHMYGNTPSRWQENLRGWDRARFIINAFTRMRFCDAAGNLEFNTSDRASVAPRGYWPWFKVPGRKTKELKIIFGHWAALAGNTDEPHVIALDTGCVWGGSLTAMCLEDGVKFSTPSLTKCK